MIVPEWPASAAVSAFMTTRDTNEDEVRARLPAAANWLRQVHGTRVIDLDAAHEEVPHADASITRSRHVVCVVRAADCMPVLLADDAGTAVGAAHAGWRGLCSGVIEATLHALQLPPERVIAWLGPAIGPRVYEVGDEVRDAFLSADAAARSAFVPNRPGHWLLDLYAVARQRLARAGVARVFGGEFCTYSEPTRFHSWRRDRSAARMAAFVWLS